MADVHINVMSVNLGVTLQPCPMITLFGVLND